MFAFANEMMFSPALRPLRRPGDPSKDMVWIPAVYNVFCDHYSGSLSQPREALVGVRCAGLPPGSTVNTDFEPRGQRSNPQARDPKHAQQEASLRHVLVPVTSRRMSDFGKSNSTCKLRFSFVSHACKIVRKPSFVDQDLLLSQRKITFCSSCVSEVTRMSAIDAARAQIATAFWN